MPAVKQHYRPEIDGMRALAVLAVVGFHAGVPGFPGGFVGVDIFFVISGYLITQVILLDADRGALSFIKFYERRVRRIMPALLVMMAVTSLAAWLLMLPDDLVGVSKSVFSMTLFSSNFYFWHLLKDYFVPDTINIPLLHTWSLAVEEQFYLAFPVLFMVVRPLGKRLVSLLILLTAIFSFALNVWLIAAGHTQSAFYIPLARAWELMLGALLAMGIIPRLTGGRIGEALAWGGLFLIALALVFLNSQTPFPGLAALLPCGGAAMLMHGTNTNHSNMARLLSFKPLRVVGLASYSIYLWHWPFMVFACYWILDPALWPTVKLLAAILALPAGWLSWKYIENPFRGHRPLFSRRQLFATAAIASIALAVTGAAGIALKGAPGRFPSPQVAMLSPTAYHSPCHNQPLASLQNGRLCRIGNPEAQPIFVIWGDSHADMYYDALNESAARHGLAGFIISSSSCPPLLGLNPEAAGMRDCASRNLAALEQISKLHPKAVILAARWAACSLENGNVAPVCAERMLDPRTNKPTNPTDAEFVLHARLLQTILRIASRDTKPYVLIDVPTAAMPVSATLAKAEILDAHIREVSLSMDNISLKVSDFSAQMSMVNRVAASLADKGTIQLIDPRPFLCGPSICPVQKNGVPYYRDAHHLTLAGARIGAKAFEPLLRSLAGD